MFQTYLPESWLVLRSGYNRYAFARDLFSGLTVSIVALPLSMAIAIASGVTPAMGLYTAIVGGFLVSAFGGSRFQIGGPAGAFIVLVAATVHRHGVDGLILATFLSGLIMMTAGFLRIGLYIKFIPHPVTIGFTAGIAVIIFASQLHDLLGLTLDGPEPGELVAKLEALWNAIPTLNPAALALAASTAAIIIVIRKLRPAWPSLLIAVAFASLAALAFDLPVETIGTRFGGIPSALPEPALPDISSERILAVLPDAVSFALLGAIESLLSAVVADGMSGTRHRSNAELLGQGIANMGAALFGGFCVTGTIARTATNVRAHAYGPVSGMVAALTLLLMMLVAAPLAAYVPLAALGGLLALVAWNMVERHAIAALFRASWGDALVFAITFLLVIFRDLTEGILAGFLVGSLLFIDRMGKAIAVEHQPPAVTGAADGTLIVRITGAFFFGAASSVGSVLDQLGDDHRTLLFDCSAVPFFDSTAATVLEQAARKAQASGVKVVIAGASRQSRRQLMAHGLRPPLARFASTIGHGLERADRNGSALRT
ncbi:MAG: SulP family inorganic anion transporter [Rhizobiaceae bacterium]